MATEKTITNLRGPAARIVAVSAKTVPADAPAAVRQSGPDQGREFEFDIPRGLPGANAIANDEANATYTRATDSATFAALSDTMGRGVSVKTFGAKGDGVTNDTAAVVAAEAAAAALGASLWFPAGVYMVDHFVTHVTMRGDRATLRLRAAGYSLVEILSSSVTIENLILDANDLANGYVIDMAIGAKSIRIVRNEIRGVLGTGTVALIRVRGGCDQLVIEDNWLHHAKSTTVGRGILIGSNDGSDTVIGVKIRGNLIEDIEPTGDGDGIVVQNFIASVDVMIAGNTFRRCRKRAIKIQCSGVIAEGNRIFNTYDAAQTAQPYSGISVYASTCRIQGNIIEGVFFVAGIELGATSVPVSDVDVCDNVILGDVNHRQGGEGISFDVATPSITRCHVSRNTIVGTRHGVRFQNVIDQTEAIGNHFTDLTGSAYVVDDNNVGTPAKIRVGGGSIKNVTNYSVTTDGGASPAVLIFDPIIGAGSFGAMTAVAAAGSRAAVHGVDPVARPLVAAAATDAATAVTLANSMRTALLGAGNVRSS